MATVTDAPAEPSSPLAPSAFLSEDAPSPPSFQHRTAIATLYDFPSMEPLNFLEYKYEHLLLPLRRDILHRAVIYEGDMTRQGTASTKWRNEVHGSSRKIRPQKGTGRARLGDKKSPMLRGGGVAFGPHPRDFSTELPRKIYDKAWRIALSYRYRRGELFIVNNNIDMPEEASTHFLSNLFAKHGWGSKFGRSLLITNVKREKLLRCGENLNGQGRILYREDVDVKDLLSLGRIIIEKSALHAILKEHSKDLMSKPRRA
jgi:large subunit ribosomal protein L4